MTQDDKDTIIFTLLVTLVTFCMGGAVGAVILYIIIL